MLHGKEYTLDADVYLIIGGYCFFEFNRLNFLSLFLVFF